MSDVGTVPTAGGLRHVPRADDPAVCVCGEEFIRSMICHPCRVGAHGDCVDGGRVDGSGRWCNCAHDERVNLRRKS